MLLFDFGDECNYNCKKLLAFLSTAAVPLIAHKWKSQDIPTIRMVGEDS